MALGLTTTATSPIHAPSAAITSPMNYKWHLSYYATTGIMIYKHKYIDHSVLFLSSAAEAVFAFLLPSVLLYKGGWLTLCVKSSNQFLVQV